MRVPTFDEIRAGQRSIPGNEYGYGGEAGLGDDSYQPFAPQKQASQFSLDSAFDPMKKALGGASSMFSGGRLNILDSAQMDRVNLDGLKGVELTNGLKQNEAIDAQNALGQFDYTGAFNTGLSAFNAYNKYNYQNDMLDMYKQDLGMKYADNARRDATRADLGSKFANSGQYATAGR